MIIIDEEAMRWLISIFAGILEATLFLRRIRVLIHLKLFKVIRIIVFDLYAFIECLILNEDQILCILLKKTTFYAISR